MDKKKVLLICWIKWFGGISLTMRKKQSKAVFMKLIQDFSLSRLLKSEGSDAIITRNGPDEISKLESSGGQNS